MIFIGGKVILPEQVRHIVHLGGITAVRDHAGCIHDPDLSGLFVFISADSDLLSGLKSVVLFLSDRQITDQVCAFLVLSIQCHGRLLIIKSILYLNITLDRNRAAGLSRRKFLIGHQGRELIVPGAQRLILVFGRGLICITRSLVLLCCLAAFCRFF